MDSRTKFQLYISKFAWVRLFSENFIKIQNLKNLTLRSILAKFNTKGPWSIYYICIQFQNNSNFIKVRATTDIFQIFQITNRASFIGMKVVTDLYGCNYFTDVPNFMSMSKAIYELSGFETLKIGHTRSQTHTSGRQLKMTFLDVLDYSEYSDTNILNCFSQKHSLLTEEAKYY